MSNFSGKNGIDVKEAFYERLRYSSKSLPKGVQSPFYDPKWHKGF